MAYELRNGKYYKIEEVDVSEVEKQVKQALAYIEQQEASIKPLSERMEAIKVRKAQEIEKLNAEISRVTVSYNNELAAYENEISKYQAKIATAVDSLKDKKDIIAVAFPDEKEKLGF